MSLSGILPRLTVGSMPYRQPRAFLVVDAAAALVAVLALVAMGQDLLILSVPLLWLAVAVFWHVARSEDSGEPGHLARGLLAVSVVAAALVGLMTLATPPDADTEMMLGLLAVTIPIALGLRFALLTVTRVMPRSAAPTAVLVGPPDRVADFIGTRNRHHGFHPVSTLRVGDDITQRVRETGAEVVVLLEGDVHGEYVRELSWELRLVGVRLVVPLPPGIAAGRLGISERQGSAVLEIAPPSPAGSHRVKEWAERSGAAVTLLLLSPLLLVIAALVKLDSRGPVFFKHQRTGLNGERFGVFKFRTMVPNAEELKAQLMASNQYSDGTLFKMKDDPRVTRVGRVLRATSLDELPQLINIARGEMSWIGPRPTSADIEAMPADYQRRVLVKPGLTGLWQVSGRSSLPWDEAVKLDLYYLENHCPALDARILARTVGAVLKRDGAY